MAKLADIQKRFLAYLQQGDRQLLQDIASSSGISNETRLHIYGNAYRQRLTEALETDHQQLGLYLGDDLFKQMVEKYCQMFPSQYTSLRDFSQHLPAFLRQTPPFSEHPILAELAQFEGLLLDAFDAPDSTRVAADALASLAPESWPTLSIAFHPSSQFFVESWNTVHSWQALKQNTAPEPAAQHSEPRHWILWRNTDLLTQFVSISPAHFAMLQVFLKGGNFADACEDLTQWLAPEHIPETALSSLQSWLNWGIVAKFN